jgi:hypothetical protein
MTLTFSFLKPAIISIGDDSNARFGKTSGSTEVHPNTVLVQAD